jgi:hypothetical protein
MPDLAAGTIVTGLDTPPADTDVQTGSYTFTNMSFGVGTTGGTYADCGVVFVAPTSGRVLVLWAGLITNSGASSQTLVSPELRTGGTLGSGTVIDAAAASRSIRNTTNIAITVGSHYLAEGLTPGDTYNVRLNHMVSGSTGTVSNRRVTVVPTS